MKMSLAEYLSYVPDDLIVEILSRLPVKDLMRFRCVCKTWKSIIFDPSFVKKHLERSSKKIHLIITREEVLYDGFDYDYGDAYAIPYSINQLFENPSSDVDEDDYYQLNGYWIIGSCNGLVCLGGYHGEEDTIYEYWVQFWNPATRMKSRKSPRLHVNPCCQGFDPSNSIGFGFLYDDLSAIYKVVSVLSNCRSKKTEVWVYNLGGNCWTNIFSCPNFPILRQNGRLVNGTINWLAIDMSSSHYEERNDIIDPLVIFSVDLQKDTYKYLLLPKGLDQIPDNDQLRIVELRDRLCLYHDRNATHFVVWQMKEFGVEKSWTLLMKVTYNHLQIPYPPDRPLLPFCISENGEVLMLVNNDVLNMTFYNRRNNRVEVIPIPNNNAWWQATNYIPSLVSPFQN
ncbi:hypothetical protein AAZX31_08G340300 [Glycine max]|nr:hypothetical protein GYH30_023390 [Glycine max]KRH46676.2 hypothetical protein GLYMA_08G350400v4 [Glycine max]|eukprot:XP_006586599.2 F-box/kelch-repeat protein At3g23880 [Glycine max]